MVKGNLLLPAPKLADHFSGSPGSTPVPDQRLGTSSRRVFPFMTPPSERMVHTTSIHWCIHPILAYYPLQQQVMADDLCSPASYSHVHMKWLPSLQLGQARAIRSRQACQAFPLVCSNATERAYTEEETQRKQQDVDKTTNTESLLFFFNSSSCFPSKANIARNQLNVQPLMNCLHRDTGCSNYNSTFPLPPPEG